MRTLLLGVVVLLAFVLQAQTVAPTPSTPTTQKSVKPEELDQLLASVALYPDDLLSQILMASTYPIEVVQAQRWIDQKKDVKGDALAAELEKQNWDPSVKSLCNFPSVLTMMSDKLDWTMKLGNAFLADRQAVMDTVQMLRAKAKEQGNLESTTQQKVSTETNGTTQTIIIQPADPQVIYVPTYNPSVVYGTWWYPAYPPYYYYPPGYYARPGVSFGAGLAIGVAWGYAWGHCDWNHGNVDIDIDRNTNINRNIDRSKYKGELNRNGNLQGNRGAWEHSPKHRQGVAYSDASVAQRFGQGSSPARDSFRGYGQPGGGASAGRDSGNSGAWYNQPRANTSDVRPGGAGDRANTWTPNAPGGSGTGNATNRVNQAQRPAQQPRVQQPRATAFDGSNNSARQTQSYSNRGHSSMNRAAPSAGRGGGGGGGMRGGGGRR